MMEPTVNLEVCALSRAEVSCHDETVFQQSDKYNAHITVYSAVQAILRLSNVTRYHTFAWCTLYTSGRCTAPSMRYQ